jgi:hypothetical protein
LILKGGLGSSYLFIGKIVSTIEGFRGKGGNFEFLQLNSCVTVALRNLRRVMDERSCNETLTMGAFKIATPSNHFGKQHLL